MTLFKGKYRVETARLRGWDYGAHAWYFVTICTHNRACYFGDAFNGSVVLSAIGKMVDQFWRAIPDHFPDADIDDFVVMPNHVHGIVIIGRKHRYSPTVGPQISLQPPGSKAIERGSLPAVVRSFKSAVSRWCALNGYPRSIWQPRYYDEIIRATADLEHFRAYIQNNPFEWDRDELKPPTL